MTASKRKGRIVTTTAEMKRAIRDAREREKTATKIRSASYERKSDALVVALSTGVTLAVPRTLIPGFMNAEPAALADVTIDPGSESLWSDTVDDGVLLEQLVQIAAGDELLQFLGGRIAGRRRSEAKANAARANGVKGGRPSLPMTAFVQHLERSLRDLATDAPTLERSEDHAGRAVDSARWQAKGRILLEIKARDRGEVDIVRSAWTIKRPRIRRIRAAAERLARDLARWILAEQKTAATRAAARNELPERTGIRKHPSRARRTSAAR
ncbi:MAG TPA: hypothetical protein VGD01_11325 [Candidatus Elarobacter sp.]|jgi:hypothetical protein